MSCCCAAPESSTRKRPTRLRRVGAAVEWAIPVAVLALIPKCPGCVAAYVLLFSGIGLSTTAAMTLRWSLVGVCVAALVYLVFRAGRRITRRAHASRGLSAS